MAKTCLGLLAGMFAAQLSSFTAISDHLNGVFVASAILLFCRQWQLAGCFVLGSFLFHVAASQLIEQRIAHSIEGDSMVVTVQVLDFPVQRRQTVSFNVRPLNSDRLPGKIRLSWFEPEQTPRPDEIWLLEVRLRRPRGTQNPGGFDIEAWLFREHIAANGYVVSGWRNRLLGQAQPSLSKGIRLQFTDRVNALLGDTEAAAVINAVVVGSRHLISAEQWQRYAVTGSSHLMAISGLHIGLAAIGGYLLARILSGLVWRRAGARNHHVLATMVALLAAMIYVQISGLALPARRAGLMLCLAGLYLLARRRPDARTVVCVACIAIVVGDPLTTMSPGFALSFAAVVTLLWFARRKLRRLAAIQLGLLVALLPLTVMFFDRVSFAAIPVNLIAVPLFSLVTVPLALAGLVLDGPFAAAGDALLKISAKSIALLEQLFRIVEQVPLASFAAPQIAGTAWLTVFLPLLWALLPPRWPGRSLAWLGLFGLTMHSPKPPEQDCAQISILDVGQGLAAVIRSHEQVVLYDTGPAFRGGGSAMRSIVLPYLQSRGIHRIDRLIVSHGDLDHAGGVEALLAELPVGRVLAGTELPSVWSQPCRAGTDWRDSGVHFSILHPPGASEFSENDGSCVLLVEVGGYRTLLTGDIEKAAERQLLESGLLPKAHVVTVPHHGSQTSSTSSFVRAVNASYAIASTGYGNRWSFPKKQVVARWQAAGAVVVNTATAGAVELEVCAGSGFTSITGYRVVKRRIWHE